MRQIPLRMQRVVGAALAEYPGDPATFKLEDLDKATRNIIRNRCRELLERAKL
jgi:hypothetical protein